MAYNYLFPTRRMSTAAVTRLSGTIVHEIRATEKMFQSYRTKYGGHAQRQRKYYVM